MIHFSVLLLGLGFIASATAATPKLCGTVHSTEAMRVAEEDFTAKRIPAHNWHKHNTKINVFWHTIQKDETLEGGHLPKQQIHDQIQVLNEAFVNSSLTFHLKRHHYVTNPEWFAAASPYDDGLDAQYAMKDALRVGGRAALNIYSVGFEEGTAAGSLLGYATFPSDYPLDRVNDGVVFLYSSAPGGTTEPYNLGGTVQHEVGHWVGLYHTFNEDELYGTCDGSTDMVDDTPMEATPATGCPIGRDSCPDAPGLDPIHNYMDYTIDSCYSEFTPGQVVRFTDQMATYRGIRF